MSYYFSLRLFVSISKAFYSSCEIRYLAIIVNLEYDSIAAFRN